MSDQYKGDISPTDAWRIFREDQRAALIDVRTVPEWHYVGLPALDSAESRLICLAWQIWPDMNINADFTHELSGQLQKLGPVDPGMPLLFLCRSGVRSRAAAIAVTQTGYNQCFNIAEGFEGDINPETMHRDRNGWKQAGLPWRQ